MVPALQGRCAPDAAALPSGLARPAAAGQLVAALQVRHPEAGRAYWALRAWALLVWQPAYASVLAVELAAGVLPLADLLWEIDVSEADVAGFSVPATVLVAAAPHRRRALAAHQLQTLSATLLGAVQACIPLHAKAARRLLADCVLAALLRAQPVTQFTDDELHQVGADWLAHLGATSDSSYLPFDTANGTTRLALDRRVCCLDDRRAGGELCNTCPRLPRAERLRRLRDHDLRSHA